MPTFAAMSALRRRAPEETIEALARPAFRYPLRRGSRERACIAGLAIYDALGRDIGVDLEPSR